ncbi:MULTISPECIES: zinc ribbon domain-containing protein [unclassified Nocardioides]|uniref:zinc ribbon domain-containing protein n=1 Tax=unclassified Nocardioides TaxID=2615069 RepID=UPI00301478D6
MVGIEEYAVYVPTPRLERAAITAALGAGRARGARPVASYDEDTTTMAVAAARQALAGGGPVESLWFATTRPAYLEKSNASTVAVASGLPPETAAYDVGGALRGGAGALRAGLAAGTALVVSSDVRFGLPGSADELGGADAAAAFRLGPDPVAELVGSASITSEFLDRWREPGDARTRTWEERFGVEEYVPLVQRAVDDVLGRCELKREQLDHVVLSLAHPRALGVVRSTFDAAQLGAPDDLGYAGAADLGLRLAAALDRARPGQLVLAVCAADGADAFVFRVTERHRGSRGSEVGAGQPVSYADFLTWRGLLPREPARRPDVKPPVPPASRRSAAWKFAFVAGRCTACGYRNLPPRRVCLRCSAQDSCEPVSMVDVPARVATFTDDWLSESVQLPAKVVAVDFEGGGRFEFEMTDAVGREVAIGDRVQPTFRLASVAGNGVRNYVWKVRPQEGDS